LKNLNLPQKRSQNSLYRWKKIFYSSLSIKMGCRFSWQNRSLSFPRQDEWLLVCKINYTFAQRHNRTLLLSW